MKEKLGGIFDGFILLAIGGFAGFLIVSGNYWYYLNPKFEWLTGLTATMLILTGAMTLVKPRRNLSIFRMAVFLFFTAVLAYGAHSGIPRSTEAQSNISTRAEVTPEEMSRVTVDGEEYIRINLAELVWIGEKQISEKIGLHYVVRGIVKRSERLDTLGYFALVRNVVTCCLADSMGLGIPIRHDSVKGFSEGQWVAVYGTIEHLNEKLPREGLRPDRMRLITLSRNYGLASTKIEKIEEPDVSFIFESREEEPYAY